jgi:hypothetical protein
MQYLSIKSACMNKYVYVCALWLMWCAQMVGQETQSKPYFQQRVDYTIQCALNDKRHELRGDVRMVYKNNSPDVLSFIYIHLWANAYKNNKTQYAKQVLEGGNTKFWYAPNSQRGYVDSMLFEVDGQAVPWSYHEKNIDIAVLTLPKPLQSGDSVVIRTPFFVKIPNNFSRLGHIRQSYQITQWYPKLAVYDREGWHPMPYLDQGEFYSEFGSFDVSITLPKNYVVAATGDLQTPSEQVFWDALAAQTAALNTQFDSTILKVPASASEVKTVRFTANNVHDFAWFADKQFLLQASDVRLPSGKKVVTRVFYTPAARTGWSSAIWYLNRSVQYYSNMVGEYPYSHATAVQGGLAVAGGMEYPMICVIPRLSGGKGLDGLIAHEVGHNWFYGILGSNERKHTWMDEGFNSYVEERYSENNYGEWGRRMQGYVPKQGKFLLGKFYDPLVVQMAQQYQQRLNRQQPIETPADKLSRVNYYINGYDMPAQMLRYLSLYLGYATFERIMHRYYDEWKFKHPSPDDFRYIAEQESKKDLSWFFDDLLKTRKRIDYTFKVLNDSTAQVTNKGEVNAPFYVFATKNNVNIASQWYNGHTGSQKIKLPSVFTKPDNWYLDNAEILSEINTRDNGQPRPIAFKPIGAIENPDRKHLYFTPTLTGNAYDKLGIGLAFYNAFFPPKRIEYTALPMYSTGTKSLTGVFDVHGSWLPLHGTNSAITLGVQGRSFHNFVNDQQNYQLRYTRIVPYLNITLPESKPHQFRSQQLNLSSIQLLQEYPKNQLDTSGQVQYLGKETRHQFFNQLTYIYHRKHTIHPYRLALNLEQHTDLDDQNNIGDNSFLKTSLDLQYSLAYPNLKNKKFDIRLFVGTFLYNPRTSSVDTLGSQFGNYPFALAANSNTDYKAQDFYFGRGKTSGIWSQQISLQQGGFKVPITNAPIGLGTSNRTIAALNLKTDFPMKLPLNIPLKAYFDIGYFQQTEISVLLSTDYKPSSQILWNTGLALELPDNAFGIYFPIATSGSLADPNSLKSILNQRGNYLSRISFTLDLTKINPAYLIRNLRF